MGWVVLASGVVLVAVAPAAAAPTVSPERWARTVCSAWSRYIDEVEVAFGEFEEISTSVEDGSLAPKKARRRAIATQKTLVDAGSGVVRAVARSAEPDVEDGAEVRRDYLATVKDYRQTDVDVLRAFRRLPTKSSSDFVEGLQSAAADGYEAWDVIGFNPLGELEEVPTLATAIDGASECAAVDRWFDLGYLSDVEIGECWDEDLTEVDCSTPHQTEIYLQTEYPAARGEPYPGSATVDQYAREQCEAAFAGYVGRDYESSSLEYVFLTPDEQGWTANDREILCAVENLDGSLGTGSARGSQR